ncbi:hypothetical protein EZS27_037272 [termite gut metagenome]|jgi:hypothetical protein|uniref:Uncharacterized protein n=1 Tax=termite gut metagenome TaxID=433724 RepID=A0A5J4PS05_9ZZZZ
MGLFNLLFQNSSTEKQMYEVRIKGSIQCNGPKMINTIILMDKTQMEMFTGSKRYEAIEGWIKANYPAAKPQNSYRNFGIEVKLAKK